MGSYTVVAQADYRNEGWSLGGGVVNLASAWNNGDDTKYASNPNYKGRAAVRFPINISNSNIPDGSAITSVTIKIRVRRTTQVGKSVTVNVLCDEDTSRYTTRTLYPGSAFATYEVGTYTVDALGKPWTKDRLNKMLVQVFSHNVPPNDGVRVSELYAVINFKARPTIKVDEPTGSVSSPSPWVRWTYTQQDGDLQKSAEYKVFTASQVGDAAFNADTETPVFAGSVDGDVVSFRMPTALGPDNYYIFARATSVFGSVSPWNSRAFSVVGASPGVPGGGFGGGIGTGAGGGFERVIADSETSNAFLTLRDGSNLLSVQQASFETAGDSLGYTSSNAVLAHDVNEFYQGIASMSVTVTAAGNALVRSSFLEIGPQTPLTARVQTKAMVDARQVWLRVRFYDDEFAEIQETMIRTNANNSAGTWTELTAVGWAPYVEDSTLYATLEIELVGCAATEQHHVDMVGLMYGLNSAWAHGGHMSRNLLTSAASDGDDPIDAEPWGAAAASSYARVPAVGVGAEGYKMFRATYDGTSPSISHVSTATAFSSTASGTGFTLNKPANVQDGDLLVAFVASDAGVGAAPDGWSVVNSIMTGTNTSSLTIMTRDALAADPSTWVGNTTATSTRRRATVTCYRGAAAVADQFPVESLTSSTSGTLSAQTASLSNGESNAWRLSAFAVRDDTATAGGMTANTQPPAAVPPIAYVGRGTNWWYGGSQGSFTINRPSGLKEHDLMLAFGSFSGTATPTAPTGWTQVRRTVRTTGNGDDHSGSLTLVVWKRTATASEPTSWTSSYTGSGVPLMAQAVAYRNCDIASAQFIAENAGTAGGNSVTTPSISNNNSKAWRVCAFSFTTNYGELTSSNEVVERTDNRTDVGAHPDVQIGIYDSNGPVSTGNHSRNGYVTGYKNSWAGIGWIAFLKPATFVPSVSNETERQDAGAASGTNALALAVYDSNGPADTGSQRVYGSYTPTSGTSVLSSCSWMGFLVPAAPVTAGEVGSNLVAPVDISRLDDAVLARSGGKITYQAAFLGSAAGTPFLKLYFYNANELIATRIAEGSSFNTHTWTKSVATFDIPDGTTRIGCGIAASDRTIGDEVYFDRVSLAFGTGTVWRRGTGRAEHPVFSVPHIEFAEDKGDGYGDWIVLGGTEKALLSYDQLSGTVTYIDQILTPLASRKYRAKTISYGLAGDIFASHYGPESDEISLIADDWWIKDPTDPEVAFKIRVKSEALEVNTASTAAVFQALGADRPVVLTEGYKGDTVSLTVFCYRLEYTGLKRLLNSRKTLFLQSNLDNAWWIRPIGDIGSETLETSQRRNNPLREVTLTFTEVDPE